MHGPRSLSGRRATAKFRDAGFYQGIHRRGGGLNVLPKVGLC